MVRVISLLMLVGCGAIGCAAPSDNVDSRMARASSAELPANALPIPIRHQPTDYSCGPTSLAAVLAFWQVADVDESTLEPALGTTPDDGTEPYALRDLAATYGLTATMRGQLNSALDPGTATKIGPIADATIDDLRRALCSGPYATPGCAPGTVIIDLQAWGSDADAADYSNAWWDGHYVVLAAIDDDDAGSVYVMDPDDTDTADDKAYATFPISDPKVGLVARWHDYFGDIPDSENVPPPAQQFFHGAVFIAAGTRGVARTTFEGGSAAPVVEME